MALLLRPVAPYRSPRAAEGRTEDRFENIADVAEIGAMAAAVRAAYAVLAEAVVHRALLRILQAVIGFADRLDARFPFAASRILVRLIFHRELAIARLSRLLLVWALDFHSLRIIDFQKER